MLFGSASPEDELSASVNSANTPDTREFVTDDEVENASYAPKLICNPTRRQRRPDDRLPRCTSSLMEATETSALLVKGLSNALRNRKMNIIAVSADTDPHPKRK